MFINTKQRSTESEIMDDFTLQGEQLRDTLDQLSRINQWLGGNLATIEALRKLVNKLPVDEQIIILDVGCGHGDTLRIMADFARKRNRNFKLIGVDANEDAIKYAKQLSQKYPEITYFSQNVFSKEFSELNYDLVLLNLFLHHFREAEILQLLSMISLKASVGVIVNDLHRNSIAYYLFKILCLTISNSMIRDDGLTSILRGFKKKEIIGYSEKLKLKNYVIHWKWAFRYLWIIETRIN
jgi:2-polyprenyl-3-methyl-5-hydroxy-6-metoxy-1,4-benzoquinol methylase